MKAKGREQDMRMLKVGRSRVYGQGDSLSLSLGFDRKLRDAPSSPGAACGASSCQDSMKKAAVSPVRACLKRLLLENNIDMEAIKFDNS